MTRTERRDPIKTYNKMSVADLQAKCDEATGGGGRVDFSKFFALAGKPADGALQPSSLIAHPSTLNPQPSTFNPQPSTLNPKVQTRRMVRQGAEK